MITSGAGVTLLPRLAVSTEVRRSELQVRPLAAPVPKRTLAWRKRSSLRAALRQVAATIRAAYPKQ